MADRITAVDVVRAGTTYEADYDIASATLLQCADELDVVLAAMHADQANEEQIWSALTGIIQRMQMAAKVSSAQSEMEGEAANG